MQDDPLKFLLAPRSIAFVGASPRPNPPGNDLMRAIRSELEGPMKGLGVQVIDVRIRRADLPRENTNQVYERMKTGFKAQADGIRAQGEAEYRRIYGEADKQRQVWDSVASTQKKLSQGLNAAVASPQSASSLQLSLENEKLKEARAAYIKALQPSGEKDADVIG